uniref:receptor-like protein 7 n=1 Tax=Erigeron canadensis TaxID=72917 RepID=UPI001CB9500E|nr:receptor-like protein 7 [Erigeron canadensis]
MCPGSGYDPITKNWNKDIDCCNWDGVECDHSTGDIIGLDLSCGMLQGIIHPNTTLFNLPRLQTLNIAHNAFVASQFPSEIPRFSHSLTHLNISDCIFTGQMPSEISFLSKLVSIDLSNNLPGFQIQPNAFNNLLQNCSRLRELVMWYVNISLVLPAYLNISSSLESLDLSTTGLLGKLPDNIFNLPRLEKLDLSNNYNLTGQLPIMTSTDNNPLKWLDLSSTGLSGEIFNSTRHLKSINYLALSNFSLVGSLPESLANLTHLITIDLSYNMLSGTLPSWLFTFPSLENIHLHYNMFTGGLPSNWLYLQSLRTLTLSGNQFDGEVNQGSTIPPSFTQLINLSVLDLSYNKFIGIWDLDTLFLSIPNLRYLDLSYSGLSVMSNNSNWYANPAFTHLGLASCNLTIFPKSLRAMINVAYLDLSNNEIHGDVPDWAGEIGGNALSHLNLSHNSITSLPQFQWNRLEDLYLQSNMIQGTFPLSVCNMSHLHCLDMSNNSIGGSIPHCLRDISSLQVIDLRTNHFHGTIPSFCENHNVIGGLFLNGNRLQGALPTSLSSCESLEILDVGNNHLNGTFPGWLGGLVNLQVLILKSNNFHGRIEIPSKVKLPFPSLIVFDLSHNTFEGHLPDIYFQNFNSMKDVPKEKTYPEYLSFYGLYFYTIIVTVKGYDLQFTKILDDYMIVDLSNNKFTGDIPNVIGTLKSLITLNLSHNSLNGRIPYSLGNLSEMESLDLSWNQLTGEIPQSLAGITALSVLNLSQNHLVGRIPEGTQFGSFENSFGGNSGLCGHPLPKMCDPHPREPLVEVDSDEEESGFTWRSVMIGYACGTLFGLLAGFLMLSFGRPKWFTEISDAAEHMILKRRSKQRYIYIGR